MVISAASIESIKEMLALSKTFSEWPVWNETGRGESSSYAFVSGLVTEGISFSGIRIRGITPQTYFDRDIVIQLEFLAHKSSWLHACRIEYKPLKGHNNPFMRKDLVRNIAAGVSHVHDFQANLSHGGSEVFSPSVNLPIAVPLELQPSSVKDFLRIVAQILNIPDFEHIELPPWQGRLSV